MCSLIACRKGVSSGMITALLVTLSLVCVWTYFSGKKIVYVCLITELAIAFFLPVQFAFLSTIVYMFWYNQMYIGTAFSVFLGSMGMLDEGGNGLVYSILVMFLAIYMAQKTRHEDELDIKVKSIRDDSEERELLLKDKNRELMQKQDQEVYVATLKERNRIAREIHDNVGHMLTRSILQLGALMTVYKNEPVGEQLGAVRENLDEAMNNIRSSVHDLHDESIDLKHSIEEIVAPLEEKYIVNLEYDVTEDMVRDYKYAVIGIVKEAVSNIIKYSDNTYVDIILREHPAMYQLVVQDYMDGNIYDNIDGKVTEVDAEGANGIGIRNMYDRVQALNGNISITKGKGYRVFVTLPKQG